ncbi:MAG: apolipoprotein N-acyltransferase, partial [Candidatus Omnitrophica bacterium]|nr:apolipoprotein N-acyltransferase [Candidatus Omnitrophota bacterium]
VKQKKTLFSVSCTLIVLSLALGYGSYRLHQQPEGKNVKIAVVQGNIPQKMKWDPEAKEDILTTYTKLTKKVAQQNPQIIIWPETSVPGFLEDDTELMREIAALSKSVSPAYLLVGTPHLGENGKIYNSATLLHQGEILQRYDKLHLVPFGEFIPGARFFSRFSFAELIGNFHPGKVYTVFEIKPELKLSVLICFEDVFGYLGRGFTKRGAQILVNMTNDAWFEDSSEPHQHLQASVFRAVENRVSVVRSANTGVSCFINPWGEIEARVTDDAGKDVLVPGVLTHTVNY